MNMMVKLGDIDNFDKIKEVADKVEKERMLSTMKLSNEELEIASQFIKDHEAKDGQSTASLSRITGLSAPCLRNIRDKKSNFMHTKTYNVFENIINATLTARAKEEEAAQDSSASEVFKRKAQTDKEVALVKCFGSYDENYVECTRDCALSLECKQVKERANEQLAREQPNKPINFNEFEIMAQMDSLFASLDESARHRVLAYFESKYILPQLDEVLNESD
jgi:hypothetical protein